MTAQPRLNISAIIGIKDGIDQVFALIEQSLEVYSKHPDNDKFIRDCKNYIHQLNGLLEMLNLTSITVVTEKLEQVVDALIIKRIQPDPSVIDALKRSTKALLFYLNELIDGAEENPLRLFPAYHTLMQAYGYANAPESDLFFPRLTAEPTLKMQVTHLDAHSVASLARQLGVEYQAGLLKWLRDPSKPEGLRRMAGVVERLEEFPGTIEQRAFWWVAGGFLEDLLHLDDDQIELAVRRLCGKIEQTIRHLAAGAADNTHLLMRELLYRIAQSNAPGQRIAEIKRCYTWPGQDPRALTFEQSETINPVLERLRDTLMQTNDIWREHCAGQEGGLTSLSEYVDWLGYQARQTDCAPLVKLIDAIGSTVVNLQAQPHDMSEELAMEMATALLLVESIIDNFNKLPSDLPEQVGALAIRLQRISTSDAGIAELPAAPSFETLDSKTGEQELLNQVCREMLSNLAQIENTLDQFFFEPAQREELMRLPVLFKQVSGTLIMMALERVDTLLCHCENLVKKLSIPDYDIVEAEQILLVDGLSSLGFFIEAYRSGRPDSLQIVEEALALFQRSTVAQPTLQPAHAAFPVTDRGSDATAPRQGGAATTADTGIDAELLAVYLEEAALVLTDITANLQRCRIDAADRPALIELRRGFHTLKGSGRMVKLDAMSEVAWSLEQVLTFYLSRQKPATDQLLGLIDRAHHAYAGWCENLHRHGVVEVDGKTLIQAAKSLLAEQSAGKPQQPGSIRADQPTIITTAREISPSTKPAAQTAAQHSVQPEQTSLQTVDAVNPELLQIFLEETHEIIPQIGNRLRGWRILPHDEDIHRGLLRLLHTLKGSARMAGALHLGEMIHAMESNIGDAFRERYVSEKALDRLESEFDTINGVIEHLQNNQSTADALPGVTTEPTAALPDKAGQLQPKTLLRINSELIDRLVNDAGETGMLRSRIETQLNSFKQSLQDLTESTQRLHDQLREVEIQAETQMQSHLAQQNESEHSFDPLEFDRFTRFQELTRLMAESVDDIINAQKNLRSSHNAAEEAVSQQSAINRQLQQSLLQIRTLPFGNSAERYYRIARQVADDLGKKTHLRIEGSEVEIDRNVLEKINPPLEHLLRNAIAHGIESPAQRLQAGKQETGQITMALRRAGNEVIITLSDDGCGLNLPRIRDQALQMGLIRADEVADDDKIMSMIFTPGLSTTDTITGIAGRGIGLDIVKNEIAQLDGRIDVESIPRQGTVFTIHLPLTLSVIQTFMVRAGKQIYAIPAFIVAHRQQFDAGNIQAMYRNHCIEHDGKQYLFAHLSHLLKVPVFVSETAQYHQVLFLHSGTQYLAVHVDELLGETEVAVKSAGSQLAKLPAVEGATITGDGDVVLILNPVKLLQRNDTKQALKLPLAKLNTAARAQSVKTPTVLIVDDSLTVRKVTCRLLEREGCEILTAKNGAEALEILQETLPDVMLIDLEMPKMNGFELIKRVRANPKSAGIPIIIISSRTAEKHQKIARELGVNVFLGKPYKEEVLLGHLSRLGFNQTG
ncbi:MAG: hybrid sensor histidine kinase/response regulator [Nitrosomonas sp.]|nr:MAG: hybrid sensor histidine kinase/response regulator [Nitrosomonas sp.]